MNELTITAIQGTGYFQNSVRKTNEQGRISEETREAIFQEKLGEERKRIQPVYNSRGKLVEYDNSGRRLNVMA